MRDNQTHVAVSSPDRASWCRTGSSLTALPGTSRQLSAAKAVEALDGGYRQEEAESLLPGGHAARDSGGGQPAGPVPLVDRPASVEDRAQRDHALPIGERRDRRRGPRRYRYP